MVTEKVTFGEGLKEMHQQAMQLSRGRAHHQCIYYQRISLGFFRACNFFFFFFPSKSSGVYISSSAFFGSSVSAFCRMLFVPQAFNKWLLNILVKVISHYCPFQARNEGKKLQQFSTQSNSLNYLECTNQQLAVLSNILGQYSLPSINITSKNICKSLGFS